MADNAEPEQAPSTEQTQADETTVSDTPGFDEADSTDESTADQGDTTDAQADDGEAEQADDSEDAESDSEGSDDLDPKQSNRNGYAERKLREKDQTIAQLQTQLEQYVQGGDGEIEQRLRGVEAREYIGKVTQARNDLVLGNQRAMSEIPMFNPDSKEYNQVAHDRIMARYAKDQVITEVITGPDGKQTEEIVGYREPLYDYLKDQADILTEAAKSGAKQGQKAEAKMRAKAETVGAKSQTGKSDAEDEFLKGFNSVK